eukprot:5264257-Amphidinium_carterae.1
MVLPLLLCLRYFAFRYAPCESLHAGKIGYFTGKALEKSSIPHLSSIEVLHCAKVAFSFDHICRAMPLWSASEVPNKAGHKKVSRKTGQSYESRSRCKETYQIAWSIDHFPAMY